MNKVLPAGLFVLPLLLLYANRGATLLLSLLGAAALVQVARRRAWRWPLAPAVTVAIAALLAWGAASALWEFTPGLALRKVAALLGIMAAGTAVLSAAAGFDEAERTRLLKAAAFGLWAAALVALADLASGMKIMLAIESLQGPLQSLGLVIPGRFKTAATGMAVVGIGVIGGLLLRRRWLEAGLTVAAVVAVAKVSGSHSAILGLGAGAAAGLLVLALPRLGPALMAAAVATMFAAAPFVDDLPPGERLSRTVLPNSALHRVEIWRFTAQRAAERPWLGWGLDGSRALPGGEDKVPVHMHLRELEYEVQELQRLPLHPHNLALQVWVELGLVGSALGAALLLSLIAVAATGRRTVRAARLASFGAAVAVGVVSYGVWQSWWVATLWLGGLAVAAATRATGRRNAV